MHCNYIEEYGKTYVGSKWETKHPYLGCHPKKGYTVKDLVRSLLNSRHASLTRYRASPAQPRRP